MQNITIGRYDHESITREYAGWIEGTRTDGTGWIIWLDADGSPIQYHASRDSSGAVLGDPIDL